MADLGEGGGLFWVKKGETGTIYRPVEAKPNGLLTRGP